MKSKDTQTNECESIKIKYCVDTHHSYPTSRKSTNALLTRAPQNPKGQIRTNPTMSIFGTKLALTSNPQADITTTGHCEYRITTVDLMKYQEKDTLSSPDDTMLPEVYTDTVACIYNVNGKCQGMLTPKRLNILRKAFDRANHSGLHNHVQPPPSFASELVGLIARKDISASKHTNKKIKDSFARILPSHITTAFQKWALVTK